MYIYHPARKYEVGRIRGSHLAEQAAYHLSEFVATMSVHHVGAEDNGSSQAAGADSDTEDTSLEEAVESMVYADIKHDPEI